MGKQDADTDETEPRFNQDTTSGNGSPCPCGSTTQDRGEGPCAVGSGRTHERAARVSHLPSLGWAGVGSRGKPHEAMGKRDAGTQPEGAWPRATAAFHATCGMSPVYLGMEHGGGL